jgi:hypothetical protein
MKNSPLNELTAQDIARKKIKLGNIEEKLSDTNISPRKERRLKEKQHKTKYQIETGQRGRPTSLRNEEWLAGTSRKSALNRNTKNIGRTIPKSSCNRKGSLTRSLSLFGYYPSQLKHASSIACAAMSPRSTDSVLI